MDLSDTIIVYAVPVSQMRKFVNDPLPTLVSSLVGSTYDVGR